VVVGEDQPLVREGIVHVLTEAGMDVVGVAGDATTLLDQARRHCPDVVVTDIQMPPDRTDDGLRAAQTIRETQPDVGVGSPEAVPGSIRSWCSEWSGGAGRPGRWTG